MSTRFVALMLLLLTGCGGGRETHPELPSYDRRFETGESSLRIRVDRTRITTAQRVTLNLELQAPEAAGAALPVIGDELGGLRVVRRHAAAPRLAAGAAVLAEEYLLEPDLPGQAGIPALQVTAGGRVVLQSEPIAIEVSSLLPSGAKDAPLREIVGPWQLPRSGAWWWAALAMVLAVIAWLLLRRRARRRPPPLVLLPHERALRELEHLHAENLFLRGESKLYFVRLSQILRGYIEERFGLRAPERTTEEFLQELKSDHRVPEHHKHELSRFLDLCDLVKFAKHPSSEAEATQAFASCKRFVLESAPEGEALGERHVPV